MNERRIGEIHPDTALDDQDQQDRHARRIEGEQQYHKNDQDGHHADNDVIDLKGLFKFVLVRGISHHIDLSVRIIALGCFPDRIGKAVGLVSCLGQCEIDQHAVIRAALKLPLAHQHLGFGVGQRVGLLAFQRDVPIVYLLADIQQYVDQRHIVLGNAADQFIIALCLYSIGSVEKFRRFIVDLQQLGELTRRELVSQLVAADRIGVCNGCDRVHLVEGFQLADQLLFRAVISARNNNSDHGAGGKGIADHLIGDLHFIEFWGLEGVIAVNVRAAVGERNGSDNQQNEDRRDHAACRIGKFPNERHLRDKILVPRLFHQIAHQHQQSRHDCEDGEQGEDDRLDQVDGHIWTETEFHEHHGHQAANGRQAAGSHLRNGLGKGNDDRVTQLVPCPLLLETVAVDDRVVQRKGKLQDRCNRVGNERDRTHQEVCSDVHDRRDDEGQANDRHLSIGLGGKGQHNDHDHSDKGCDHIHFLLDQLCAHIAERGRNIGIIGFKQRSDRRKRREAGLIRFLIVKRDRIECGCLAVMLACIVKIHTLHAIHAFDRIAKRLGLFIGEVGRHDLGGAVSNELLLHQIQALFRAGSGGEICRQVVFHLDPVARENRENNCDPHQQEDQIPFIHDKGCHPYHDIRFILFCMFHRVRSFRSLFYMPDK